MSKSVSDPAGTILLSDKPDQAAKKIMSATTDSLKKIDFDFTNQPGVSNLLQILALLTDKDQEVVNRKWRGRDNYADLKSEVAKTVSTFLEQVQTKISKVSSDTVLSKLISDELAMSKVANEKLLTVQRAVGLRADK
jgi:tryptophanyl-tRNA synthetase